MANDKAELSNPHFEAELANPDNPRSVINLVPIKLAARIQALLGSAEDRAWALLPEYELWREIRRRGYQPSRIDSQLRVNFWFEYNRCQTACDSNMNMQAVLNCVISRESFYEFYIMKPERVAWLLCAPASYRQKLEDTLCLAVDRIREVVDKIKVESEMGVIRCNVELLLKINQVLDLRLRGVDPRGKPQKISKIIEEQTEDINEIVELTIEDEIKQQEEMLEKLRVAAELPRIK